ncbi:hypothetical protein [Clostridiisalibacter paucivorans]|uniref:hypothetical protein n=1 Tax=Clostridiisalibacter paucivorans TaxID=408753 RepID=UPI00047ACA96|nr:hypothetical protein [Clostridiisalibacter paucivorans]
MNIKDRILKLNLIEIKFIEITLILYVAISILREYLLIEPLGTFGRLSRYFLLAIFMYVFLFVFIKNSKVIIRFFSKYRILLTHITFLVISTIINLNYIKEYISYILLILFVVVAVLSLRERFQKIVFILYVCAGIYTFYSVFITKNIYVAPGTRDFLFLELNRIRLNTEGIQFSIIASYMGVLSIMWLSIIQNKILKYLGFLLLGYLSLTIGKVTIIITMFLVVSIYLILRVLKSKGKNVVYISLFLTAFSSVLVSKIAIKLFNIPMYKADILFNNRVSIWDNYLSNIFSGGIIDFFFGYGFFDASLSTNFLLFHPHNQFLGAMYITGIFGFVSYLLLWFDALKVTYKKNVAKKNYFETILLLFILFIQIGDDYIFFTVEPLYLMLFMYIYIKNSINDRFNLSEMKKGNVEGSK